MEKTVNNQGGSHVYKSLRKWVENYKPGDAFDHGDMAACWYAARRSLSAVSAIKSPSLDHQMSIEKMVDRFLAWQAEWPQDIQVQEFPA